MRTPTLEGMGPPKVARPEVTGPRPVKLEPIRLEPPAEQRKKPWLWVALVTSLVLLVASIAAIAWEQRRVGDANAALAASQTELTASQNEVVQLGDQLVRQSSLVGRLYAQTQRLRMALAGSTIQGSQLASDLRQTQAQLTTADENLAAARADYRATRAELLGLAGTPLTDGTWTGTLYLVGGMQTPPTLAFDEMKLFTGQDAVKAMIADGSTPAEAARCEPHCVYWRNPSPEWRIMQIDPNTTVTLQSFRFQKEGGFHPTGVSLREFDRLYNGTASWNAHFAHASYRLTVEGGRVAAIEELNLSP